uniref:NADH-ubiquinone oxidoreductase chain 3 n=1 Tax=Megalodontes quinquecinctus TaxID=2491145 RepID=A0A3S8V0X8_9HYME|nr:NADH dehydrogenase subunit 3 [Megalodontes quinquecinctus]
MYLIYYTSVMIALITIILIVLSLILNMKSFNSREKNSPFECGFDPIMYSRMNFSLQFFLFAMIFLIFDIEIAILLPMCLCWKYSNMFTWMVTSMSSIIIIILGLYYEWNFGLLNWMK